MSKKNIVINDFTLFYELMKSTSKIVSSAKLQLSETGLEIYGARKPFARCEIKSNAIYSDSGEFSVSILDLSTFVKILQTVKEIQDNDYTDFRFYLENEKLCFNSKKFKSKIQTQNEKTIENWISTKIQTQLNPIFEFKTNNDLIKRIRNHQFIFTDISTLRVYLETKADMENNVVFATLGNKQNSLDNEITLKFGLVTFGSLENKNVILDIDRINLFDVVQTNDINISLMDANVLVYNVSITGKNDTYFNIKLYTSILKN